MLSGSDYSTYATENCDYILIIVVFTCLKGLNYAMKDETLWPYNGPLDPNNEHMRQLLSRKKSFGNYMNSR